MADESRIGYGEAISGMIVLRTAGRCDDQMQRAATMKGTDDHVHYYAESPGDSS
jgi:hypothetical protein